MTADKVNLFGRTRHYFSEGRFIKIYRINDLLDPDWEDRTRLIEKLSMRHDFIPPITFTRENDTEIRYSQLRINRKPVDPTGLSQHLERVAEGLDSIAGDGFIHGDINFKNLMFDGTSYRLIDLEPSLRQRRKGRVTLMYTVPYIARDDFYNDCLTPCTDKVGFYFFCRRMLCPIARFLPMGEMQRTIAGQSIVERFTGLPEYVFSIMNFTVILKYVLENRVIVKL